jgi:hypothetical protein
LPEANLIQSTVILSVLAVVSAAAQQPAKADQEAVSRRLPDQTDKVFAKWDSTVTPGCALSVMKDDQIVYKRGYGMADLDHDVLITPDTIFHVASISKQFTAAAILLLVQDGKLSLDDDVHKYISELPDFGVPITIRQLVHHTSGLRDQWDLLGLAGWRYSLDLITDDDVMELISHQKALNFKPGEKHMYCNTGYTLLAQIVSILAWAVPRWLRSNCSAASSIAGKSWTMRLAWNTERIAALRSSSTVAPTRDIVPTCFVFRSSTFPSRAFAIKPTPILSSWPARSRTFIWRSG